MPDVEGFFAYEIRVGTVISVEEFPEARVPAYKLRVHFGPEVGEKRSSARITERYSSDDLAGRQVVCVVNFPPKQIGPFTSEALVLGFETPDGVVLLSPDDEVHDGTRVT